MRAFFARGVDMFGARLVVEQLPMLIHLSLSLFFCGLGIFLFNTNHAVFCSVVWLIVFFSMVYGLVTLMPIFWLNSPYFTPLSGLVFRVVHLELATSTVFFVVSFFGKLETWERLYRWLRRRRRWAFGGLEKGAEEIVSERSWEFDLRILHWSIGALSDDDALEKFFEAIPGFFDSKVVKHLEGDFPKYLLNTFWNALNGFLRRSLSSNLVSKPIKSYKLDIGMNAMNVISSSRASNTSSISYDILVGGWDQVPQIAEMELDQLLTYCTSDHELTAHYAQCIVAKILASLPERDGRWIQFATGAFGLSGHDLRDYVDHDHDSVSLAISIHLIRQSIRSRFYDWDALRAFSKLDDIRNTLPRLQHDFCVLWNEVVREARKQGVYSPPVVILRWSRLQFISLHQDTGANPTNFSPYPSSYPLCEVTSHRPHLTDHAPVPDFPTVPVPSQLGDSPDGSPQQLTPGGSTVPRQGEGINIITGPAFPSDPTTTNEIRQALTFASPLATDVHDDSRDRNQIIPIDVFRHQTQSLRPVPSPPGVAASSLKRKGHQHGLN
jgi:hypothetical protein